MLRAVGTVIEAAAVPGRHSCRNRRAWMFVFSVQEEPPTHPDSWFMFPDVSWTLRSGRKFLQMLLMLLQQRSIPLLFSVLRFHCFLMQMSFHSGWWCWWGVAQGVAAPKMWAEICVGLLRNETRLEESLFWPSESVFFWGNLKSPFRLCLPPPPPHLLLLFFFIDGGQTGGLLRAASFLIKGCRRSEKSRICSASWRVKEEHCFNGGLKDESVISQHNNRGKGDERGFMGDWLSHLKKKKKCHLT